MHALSDLQALPNEIMAKIFSILVCQGETEHFAALAQTNSRFAAVAKAIKHLLHFAVLIRPFML